MTLFSLKSIKPIIKPMGITLAVCSIFFSDATYAVNFNVATMLVNFSEAVPNLMRLVTALAYVMGFFFIVKGIIDLKQLGEARSMMQEHSVSKPLIAITVGTLLIYLPASVQTGLSTFWTSPNPYGYLSSTSEDTWGDLLNAVFMVVQLVGVIAFIRGVLMLTHAAGHGGQPGTFSKAVAHIVAGILCINLYQFLQAIFETLGISGLIP